MKFSEHWLRCIVDPQLTSPELAHLLTMAGLEVEARDSVAPSFDRVVVGYVTEVEAHPNADRLRVCSVDIGSEILKIVCGAPNARGGMKVACALVGAQLPTSTIAKAKVRGIESSGMLCSARELGLGEDHGGILELGGDAQSGADVRRYLDLDDFVLTLKLTPNRGDCLSIRGLAREIAALTGAQPQWPELRAISAHTTEQVAVHLEAGDACPRYCGRVVRALNAEAMTPAWMVRRLERGGVRPISAVVDITNYVMLELGQPLHAFDLDRLRGDVRVRFATPGERLRLLNGRELDLGAAHLIISDEAGPLALAGVMGGETSGVSSTTEAVFLESAFFAPDVVAQGGRGLELSSDASHRFERGVDFAATREAIERATELMLQICGGEAGPVTETAGTLPPRPTIRLRGERVRRVLGIEIGVQETAAALRRLGLDVAEGEGILDVSPPSFRFDLAIEEDLIEEVARIHGYERIVSSLPAASLPMLPLAESKLDAHTLKQMLAARDYFEVVMFSFVDRQLEIDFSGREDSVALANPIASQMSVMRSSLIGSLVECARFNVAHKQDRVRVFEIAGCFMPAAGEPSQVERIAGLCYGLAGPEQWGASARQVDYFDARGDLEALFGPDRLSFVAATHPAFHPGQCARVSIDGQSAGWLGTMHPRWVQKYEFASAPVAFELDLVVVSTVPIPRFQPVPRFPPVRRDLALFVDESVAAEALLATMRVAGQPLLSDVVLFDVYRGPGVSEGRKSLAFRVLLQDTEKTLTDANVDEVIQRLVNILHNKHGATLRS